MQATKFLTPLQQLNAANIETHLMAFEIAIRKGLFWKSKKNLVISLLRCFAGKVLLMLQAIKRAFRIEPENALVHSCLVRFLIFRSRAGALPAAVTQVINSETKSIFQARDARQMNAQYLARHGRSLPARLEGNTPLLRQQSEFSNFLSAVARMMYLLEPSSQESAISLATALDSELEEVNLKVKGF